MFFYLWFTVQVLPDVRRFTQFKNRFTPDVSNLSCSSFAMAQDVSVKAGVLVEERDSIQSSTSNLGDMNQTSRPSCGVT